VTELELPNCIYPFITDLPIHLCTNALQTLLPLLSYDNVPVSTVQTTQIIVVTVTLVSVGSKLTGLTVRSVQCIFTGQYMC